MKPEMEENTTKNRLRLTVVFSLYFKNPTSMGVIRIAPPTPTLIAIIPTPNPMKKSFLLSMAGSSLCSGIVMKNLIIAINTKARNKAPSISFEVFFTIYPLKKAPNAPPIASESPFFIFKKPFL